MNKNNKDNFFGNNDEYDVWVMAADNLTIMTLDIDLKKQLAQSFNKRAITKSMASEKFLLANEEERKKIIEEVNNEFVNFCMELKTNKLTDRVKQEIDILEKREVILIDKIESLKTILKPFVQQRDFKKIRQLVFNFKKSLLKEMKKVSLVENPNAITNDDFLVILQNVKNDLKIDYFWTRIKR